MTTRGRPRIVHRNAGTRDGGELFRVAADRWWAAECIDCAEASGSAGPTGRVDEVIAAMWDSAQREAERIAAESGIRR